MSDTKEMYGFKVGETVETLFELKDERNKVFPVGTKIRIVAIAPKVFAPARKEYRAQTQDGKAYFFNAVPDGTIDFWENFGREPDKKSDLPLGDRIRANFITIRKIK